MLEASAPLWRWRLFGLGLAVAGACLLVTQSLLSYWLFTEKPIFMSRVQLISTLYHVMIGLHVWACVVWLNPLLARLYPETLAPRMLFGQLLNFSGAILVTIAVYLNLFPYLMNREVYPAGLYISAQRAILVALLINGWLLMRDFATAEDGRAARLQQETDAMATDVDRSELAMLEAQIEPHFLFNTLAHIKRLYRIDDGSASEVLKNLIDYLERALPALRRDDWRLDDELDLINLYLALIEQRFAGRLRYTIDAAPQARAMRLPALTVATLVENAVKHGLGPKSGAGAIAIRATLSETELLIEVSDDGVGLRQTSGKGLGLATVKARLRGRFGHAAVLEVGPGPDAGVLASIRIATGERHG